jgi:hypothetical protein
MGRAAGLFPQPAEFIHGNSGPVFTPARGFQIRGDSFPDPITGRSLPIDPNLVPSKRHAEAGQRRLGTFQRQTTSDRSDPRNVSKANDI